MGKLLLLIMAVVPTLSYGASFDDRLASANAILTARENQARSTWMYEHVGSRTKPVLDHFLLTVSNADVSGFILIGDVETSGKIKNIVVRPSTNIAQCVARDLQSVTFEKPPLTRSERSLPLILDSVNVP